MKYKNEKIIIMVMIFYNMIEVVIVLGNHDEKIMKKRVDRALEYFYSNPAQNCKYLLLSGGSVDGKSKPESTIMMDKYCQKVDKKFCILETKSCTTIENLQFSKEIIEELFSKSTLKPKITVCTSSFHLYRALIMTKLTFQNYSTNFIHTNEPIPSDLQETEMHQLHLFLDKCADKCVTQKIKAKL